MAVGMTRWKGSGAWCDSEETTATEWPLHSAVGPNLDLQLIKKLLEASADPNGVDSLSSTPLAKVAASDHQDAVEAVRLLFNAQADVDKGNEPEGRTPLYIASRTGHLNICRQLCAQGADVDLPDIDGKTPLYVASREGHTACVRELLLRGANPNAGLPLHAAAQFNNEDCLRELLLSGAVPSVTDRLGRAALHHAADQGASVALVRRLLNVTVPKTDISLPDRAGRTPLMLAAAGGYADVVGALLDVSAEVDMTASDGQTALLRAASSASAKCVRMLIAADANVGHAARTGDTALHKAAAAGSTECIKLLLRASADVNATNQAGLTPLHLAAKAEHLDAATIILKRWPSALVVDTTSEMLAEAMRKQSQCWLKAEDTLSGAIESECLPWVQKHCGDMTQSEVAAVLENAPPIESLQDGGGAAEVWFTLGCRAGNLPFAVGTALIGNLAGAVDVACARGSFPVEVSATDRSSAMEILAHYSNDPLRAEVCFRIACFLGDAAGATAALLLQNSIESIKSAITSETLPVFAVETGDEILNAHADDSSRQAALFALACYHKKGTAAMRAGLHHNNTSDVKTAILANRVPKSPPEAATHLLSSVAKDESRQLLAMMFLCNQGELLPLVTGLLRLASVEATYTLIGDLQSRMPPWMEEAEAVIVAAIGGCDGESAAAVAFLLAYHYDVKSALAMYLGESKFEKESGNPDSVGIFLKDTRVPAPSDERVTMVATAIRRKLADTCREAEVAHKTSGAYTLTQISACALDIGDAINKHLIRYVDEPLAVLARSHPDSLRNAIVPSWYETALVEPAAHLLWDLINADVEAAATSTARADECRKLAKAGGIGFSAEYNNVVLRGVGTTQCYNDLRASSEKSLLAVKERHPQWPRQPLPQGEATVARVKLQAIQHRGRFERLVPDLADEIGLKISIRKIVSSYNIVMRAYFEGDISSVCNINSCLATTPDLQAILKAIAVVSGQRVLLCGAETIDLRESGLRRTFGGWADVAILFRIDGTMKHVHELRILHSSVKSIRTRAEPTKRVLAMYAVEVLNAATTRSSWGTPTEPSRSSPQPSPSPQKYNFAELGAQGRLRSRRGSSWGDWEGADSPPVGDGPSRQSSMTSPATSPSSRDSRSQSRAASRTGSRPASRPTSTGVANTSVKSRGRPISAWVARQENGGGLFGWTTWKRRWLVVQGGFLSFHPSPHPNQTLSARELESTMLDAALIDLDGARVALVAKSSTRFCITPHDTVAGKIWLDADGTDHSRDEWIAGLTSWPNCVFQYSQF